MPFANCASDSFSTMALYKSIYLLTYLLNSGCLCEMWVWQVNGVCHKGIRDLVGGVFL